MAIESMKREQRSMVIVFIVPGGIASEGFSCWRRECGHQTASCSARVAEASGEANLLIARRLQSAANALASITPGR
jgi:hypothetical protein